MIDIGDAAPDFTLKNQHGEDISLTSFRGTPVVLVFFLFAFSGICSGELAEIRDRMSELDGAEVLADVGVAERGSFVIDGERIVRWKVVQGIGDARDLGAYRKALESLG